MLLYRLVVGLLMMGGEERAEAGDAEGKDTQTEKRDTKKACLYRDDTILRWQSEMGGILNFQFVGALW
jgi:hypothetical protein